MKELEVTKQHLMLDPNKWLRECKTPGSFPSLGLLGWPANQAWHTSRGEVSVDGAGTRGLDAIKWTQ